MTSSELISVTMVVTGAAFLFGSLLAAGMIRSLVSETFQRRWKVIIYLIRFFLLGYLVYVITITYKLHISMELVSGAVFLGGAVFVFLIVRLSKTTILALKDAEEKLMELNNSLEQRVEARTQELQRSYEFSRTVLDSVIDPISIIDIESFNIVAANKVFLEEVGLTEQEVIGKTCYEITHHRTKPCEAPHDICPLTDCLQSGDHATAEHTHFMPNGDARTVEVLTSPIRNAGGKIIQAVHIQRDITERRQSEEKIRSLAFYDTLTGLPNRSFHRELLIRAIAHAKRNSKTMATMFLDLDGFKKINDSLGHDMGDELLRLTAERLLSCLRGSDGIARVNEENSANSVVSRLGGDEFIILLNEIAHDTDASLVARRLLKAFEQPFSLNGNDVHITASIGISLYPADGETSEELLKCADIAMYHTKAHGKNNFHFFSSAMNREAVKRLSLENDLRLALEKGEFLLHYQPKIFATDRRISGMEALIRWQHPRSGMIPPLDFIPIAEETGLIDLIGQWVLREACTQNKKWQDSGIVRIPVAVNLSLHQIKNRNIVNTIKEILEETGLEPGFLELEITESIAMHNPLTTITILKELQDMGVRISIDDFGTGYSSLAYLRQLPLDTLKIDRSFVNAITTKPDDAVIVRTIIAMAHSLNLSVVAEGVETEEQYAFLQSFNCDEIQGYLFSRPVPTADFPGLPLVLDSQVTGFQGSRDRDIMTGA
ncbi:MAG: EAL domain-containing protein [Desulfobacteraceae bacterium]|nr:EAL domain-containing protein [Desulfobacteraceae bacterium]